jgi:RNA polymerase sigma-70 factor (ECF subfamily)
VRSLLRRLCCGDSAQADDLAQETFARAYKGLAKYRSGAKFSSWIFRIAYNVFLTDQKRTQRARELVSALPQHTPPGIEQDGTLHADLERALAQLAPSERAAVVLACGHGSSHCDIAEVLDCPLGTAKTCIARAKAKLREHLAAYANVEVR